MKNFHRTLISFVRVVQLKWKLNATFSVVLLTLSSCLIPPAQAFNPKDMDTVLSGKDCVRCDLSGADLVGRDLKNIILRNANLSKASLNFASLKNADLSGANLGGAELGFAFLFGTRFDKANLQKAILMGSYLHRADLSKNDLSGVDLSRAYLFDTKLTEANLSGANLEGTALSGANLSKANLSNALLKEALYDQSTLFPIGFDPKTAGLVTSRPSSEELKEPDRYNAQLAELHQLSFASLALGMGAADEYAYGGCKDFSCFAPAIIVSERKLKLNREVFGEQSPEVVSALSELAALNREIKQYNRAEKFDLQASEILKKRGKPEASIAKKLDWNTFLKTGKPDEPLAQEFARVFTAQGSAQDYRLKEKYAEALPLYEQVLAFWENAPSSAFDFQVVITLSDLATVNLKLGNYAKAEALYKRALAINEDQKVVVTDGTLLGLALAHHAQGHKAEAKALYEQILKIWKERFPKENGPDYFVVTSTKNNLKRLQESLPPVIDIK